jgi:putative heme-binding domain-containing protein
VKESVVSQNGVAWIAAAIFFGSAALAAAQNPTMLGHPEDYPRVDVEHGARLYAEHCDRCHGANGNGVSGVDLRSGKFRNATTDQQLRGVITNGFPTAGMPPFTFDAADLTGLVAYLRNMNSIDRGSLKPGDAAHGRLVVETKGACLSCHRINEVGSRKAPNLSTIGSERSAGSLERSLLDPTSQMWPINRPVHIVTKDGKVINGRRLNEDTYTVQVADEEGRLISLNKPELREFTVSPRSTMPSYKQELSPDELADVVTYLLSLKGK